MKHALTYSFIASLCLLTLNQEAYGQTETYVSGGDTLYVSPGSFLHLEGNAIGSGYIQLDADTTGYGQLSMAENSSPSSNVHLIVGKTLDNTNAGWRQFGFPFAGDLDNLDFNSSLAFVNETNDSGITSRHNFYTWKSAEAANDSAQGWEVAASNSALPHAYAVYSNPTNGIHSFSKQLEITGTIYDVDNAVNFAGEYTIDPSFVSGNVADASGWVMAYNPFPCNLSISTLLDHFGDHGGPSYEAMHIFDQISGNYKAVLPSGIAIDFNTTGGTDNLTTHIEPLQAFWIKFDNGMTNVQIPSSVQDPEGTATKFMKTHTDLLRLNFSNGQNGLDQIVVYFDPAATSTGVDPSLDALKRGTGTTSVSVLNENENSLLSISALPYGAYALPLEIRSSDWGSTHTFQLLDGLLNPFTTVELEDTKTQRRYDLRSQKEVDLVVNDLDQNGRFILHINSSSVSEGEITSAHAESFNLIGWGTRTGIQVHFSQSVSAGHLEVFNLNGQRIADHHLNEENKDSFHISGNFTPGMYIVTYTHQGTLLRTKLLVND